MAQYNTGTVSVTNGSPTVMGTDTLWNGLSTPLYFKINDDGVPVYEVAVIVSDVEITLASNYQGSTESELSYQLVQDFSVNYGFPLPSQGDLDAGDWLRRTIVEVDSQIAAIVGGVTFTQFGDGDTSPSVAGKNNFKTNNSTSTTIVRFDDGTDGQLIWVVFGDGNTIVDFSGTNLKSNGGIDWAPAQGDHMIAKFDGTYWYCSIFHNS